jgi:hypothetical protein
VLYDFVGPGAMGVMHASNTLLVTAERAKVLALDGFPCLPGAGRKIACSEKPFLYIIISRSAPSSMDRVPTLPRVA